MTWMKNRIVEAAVNSASPCEQGACKNCDKPGLLIHPFRYSAFFSEDPYVMDMVPKLGPSAGESLPELKTSKYAIRMMREGYIYIVLDRGGFRHLDSYYVRPSGRLMRFRGEPPDRKTSDIACKRMAGSANALMVAIESPEEVSMSYWLFTPDPLSESKEADLIEQAPALLANGSLQGFSPQQWMNQQGTQEFAISPRAMSSFVLEYMATTDINSIAKLREPMVAALNEQPFPALCDSQEPRPAPQFSGRPGGPYRSKLDESLSVLKDALQLMQSTGGVGIALQDAIGITQELNAWRNRAMEGVEEWMHVVDKNGVDNEWKYLAAHQYAELRDGVLENRLKVATDWAVTVSNAPYDQTERELEELKRKGGFIDPGPTIAIVRAAREADIFGQRKRSIEEAHALTTAQFAKTESLLDGEQASILNEFNVLAAPCEQKMRERAPDHLAWLTSPMLKLALRSYDQEDLERGWAFAVQVGMAMSGMESDESSRLVLDGWWKNLQLLDEGEDQIAEGNLAWRIYSLNHLPLAKQLHQALELSRREHRSVDGWKIAASAQEFTSKALELFDKSNAALRACEDAGQVTWFKRSLLGVLMSWYAQLGRVAYNTATNTVVDQALMRLLVRAMQLRMGSYAQQFPVAEFHASSAGNGMSAYWRGQMNRFIREGIERELAKGRSGGAYQGRVLAMATLFESVNLIIKGKSIFKDDATAREGAEFIASGMALTGGVIAIFEEGANWVANNFNRGAQTYAYSRVWGGRLGFYGGALAGTAGLLGAVLDGSSAHDSYRREHQILSLAYASRGVVAASAAAIGATISFAGSAPFLRVMLGRARDPLLRIMLTHASGLAARLLAREAVILMLRTWGARMGWAAAALTVLIIVLSPTDLEEWCDRSVFRKDKSRRQYRSSAEELLAIFQLTKQGA